MNRYIIKGMEKYLNEEHHPWHMPGHKRKNISSDVNGKVDVAIDYAMYLDVTEVPGTDDLHHPEFMIKNSMEELKKIYGTYASYYLINGSTTGIHTAIAACFDERKSNKTIIDYSTDDYDIIITSNCHKSVYNIIDLLNLKPFILEMNMIKDENLPRIHGAVSPESVEEICRRINNVKAMVITSPTYEGVVSDIKAIKDVLNKYDITLIVDEAHGAHLPFLKKCPESAIKLGADLVIQSLHKTLPSLTQTAILHVNNELLNNKIKKYLSVFMSSSPSYMLLCSMEKAISWAHEQNHDKYINALTEFRKKTQKFNYIDVLKKEQAVMAGVYDYDETRIVITTKNCRANIPGIFIERRINEIGSIVCEMSGIDYVVLISSLVDKEDDFNHLYNVLYQLDKELAMSSNNIFGSDSNLCDEEYEEKLRNMIGTKSKDNIYVYPPGAYIVKANEVISKEKIDLLLEYKKSGKEIRGI